MSAKRNYVLFGVLISVVLHGLVLDWLHAPAVPTKGVLPLRAGLHSANPEPERPTASAESTQMRTGEAHHAPDPVPRRPDPAAPRPDSAGQVAGPNIPTPVSPPSSGLAWRAMSIEEQQALARVQLAAAWRGADKALSAPVVVRIARDGVTGAVVVEAIDGGAEAQVVQRALKQMLEGSPGLIPADLPLPLILEFEPVLTQAR